MKRVLFCFGLIICSEALAVATIPSGRCALLYDAISSTGPEGKTTVEPGHWSPYISDFNTGASAGKKFTCLHDYAGDIEMYCNPPAKPCVYSGPGQNVFSYYTSGAASTAAYRKDFSNALILPIVDGSTSSPLLKALSYADVGKNTADLVADQVCADTNSDGVFFDIEKFDITVPGQFAFYRQISQRFAESTCQGGKLIFAVFLNPNNVTDWGQVKAAFGNNGYSVPGSYDVRDTQPPTPTPIDAYNSSITGMLSIMNDASKKYGIPWMPAIPCSASFGEFQVYGEYIAAPPYFKLIEDFSKTEGITQLLYVQTFQAIIKKLNVGPLYKGFVCWRYGQYTSPKGEQSLLPAQPDKSTVKYLQNN